MSRKLVSLFLALCLCLTLASTAMAAVTPAGSYPIVDEPATLKVWAALCPPVDDYYTSTMTLWFEEQTGVHVEWTQVSSSEWQTLFNTALASGDWPDIFMPKTTSGAEFLQYAEDGVLIPINDLIDEYGYYIKDMFEKYPDVKGAVTAPDGNIYGFPSMTYNYSGPLMNKLWVYTEWLERYKTETGKDVPATPEELKDMLSFFRDNDMNGNGDTTDEIVLTGNYNRAEQGSDPCYYILNAYCFLPTFPETDTFLYIEDGAVKTDVMSDGYREGLKFLNELYNEGLLSEDIFVQDLNTMRSITTTTKDKVIVACCAAPFSGRLLNGGSQENDVHIRDYTAIAPLKTENYGPVAPTTTVERTELHCFITSQCEHPEIAFRWMDLFYSIEAQRYMMNGGLEGIDWAWVDTPSLGGDDKAIQSLHEGDDPNKPTAWNPDWCGVAYRNREVALAGSALDLNGKLTGAAVDWAAMDLYNQYAKQSGIPYMVWCADTDVNADFAEQEALFKKYVKTALSEFVLGIRDINSDEAWNEYLKQLDSIDVEAFLDLAATYYSLK